MRRTIVYIDGFNLYHAIHDLRRPHLKWVDLRALSESLLRPGDVLKAVKYFSAYATWLPEPYERHRHYTSALTARGVQMHMGKFKAKPRKCLKCRAEWTGHEEKETDVQIAVHMVSDALRGEVDRLILISADTDLAPPIKMISAHAPKCEVFVASPPGRKAKSHGLGPRLEITPGRLGRCLLPEECEVGRGRTIRRPESYNPPT